MPMWWFYALVRNSKWYCWWRRLTNNKTTTFAYTSISADNSPHYTKFFWSFFRLRQGRTVGHRRINQAVSSAYLLASDSTRSVPIGCWWSSPGCLRVVRGDWCIQIAACVSTMIWVTPWYNGVDRRARSIKPKFHYADFATKSGTSSRQSRGHKSWKSADFVGDKVRLIPTRAITPISPFNLWAHRQGL